MQLCDKEILRELKSGELVFAGTVPNLPFEQRQIQPASIDLRLGNTISRFRSDMKSYDVHDKINPEKDLVTTQLKEGQAFTIQPKEVAVEAYCVQSVLRLSQKSAGQTQIDSRP